VTDPFLPDGVDPPDFYVAAIGRSGSTMLCNWLATPPERLVFLEPFFLRSMNSRLLRIQLRDFGMAISDDEWDERDETAAERFGRVMGDRLKGRRWAFKEVLCGEHLKVIDRLRPARVLITVRNIADVALSFFEKHRTQSNLDPFSDDWVVDYCLRETAGILEFRNKLEASQIPYRSVRYEDVTKSADERVSVAGFVGWSGGGKTTSHLAEFDRAFEIERHGVSISDKLRTSDDRNLCYDEIRLSELISSRCSNYQGTFGYC
jgi:hypothetical protein